MKTEEMPNGLTNYLETFYQMAVQVEEDLHCSDVEIGVGECWELTQQWTLEFEKEYEERNWDDGAFFDEVTDFTRSKIEAIKKERL